MVGQTLLEIEQEDLHDRLRGLEEELMVLHENIGFMQKDKEEFNVNKTSLEVNYKEVISKKNDLERILLDKEKECELLKSDSIKLKHNNEELKKSKERILEISEDDKIMINDYEKTISVLEDKLKTKVRDFEDKEHGDLENKQILLEEVEMLREKERD